MKKEERKIVEAWAQASDERDRYAEILYLISRRSCEQEAINGKKCAQRPKRASGNCCPCLAKRALEFARCNFCGNKATCYGAYEGKTIKSHACDNCCGHGNEDGRCAQLDPDVYDPNA